MSARDDLIQYRFLKAEVERIEEKIQELDVERKQLIETDMVEGSDVEFPYTKHKMSIVGIDFTYEEALELNSMYQELIRQLRHKRLEAKRSYIRAMGFIYEAPDILTRRALEYRYIDGMTWVQIAMKIGCNTEDSVRKMCSAYLKKYD